MPSESNAIPQLFITERTHEARMIYMLSLYMVSNMTFLFAQIVTHYTDPMTLGGFFHLAVNFILHVGKYVYV